MDWSDIEAPSLDDIEAIARAAFDALPAEFRALCGEVVMMVSDFPEEDVIRDMGLESEFEILGLFQGPDLAGRESGQLSDGPSMVFLYRRPLLDHWAEHKETLGHLVRHVLIHEIGHHFGLSDEDMDAIEAKAG